MEEKIELIKKSFEFKHLKKYKEAIEMLYKALEYNINPQDSVELLSQIGDLHILLNNYDRALDEFQKALTINKNHIHSIQKCYDIYCDTKQYKKAIDIAQKMCEQNKTPQAFYNYINVLIKLEKYQDALEVFNSLDESLKFDTNLLYLISTISTSEKKKLILEKIISLDKTHLNANLDLAKIEFENKNYNKVIQYCLNIDEDNPMVEYYLGNIEYSRLNYIKAIEFYIKAIELDCDEHNFYLPLAKVYIDISWLNEAYSALRKSINLSLIKNNKAELNETYFLSGWIQIKQQEYSKALMNLNSIGKNSKFYNIAQILIQTINLKNKNHASAMSELEKYYETEENNPILLDTLASCYKELKLYKKAINTYKKARSLYPDSIYYNLELIDLYIDNKNYEEAQKLIKKTEEKYKNCANIYNSLARIYYRLNDTLNALNSIDKYLSLDCNNPEAFYFKGLILNDLSNFEEAKTCIYNAIKLNPSQDKYYSQMARSYCGINDFESALLYSKEAIEINPDEINYKKQAYDISLKIGNKNQIEMYKNQLIRSEKILKLKR